MSKKLFGLFGGKKEDKKKKEKQKAKELGLSDAEFEGNILNLHAIGNSGLSHVCYGFY